MIKNSAVVATFLANRHVVIAGGTAASEDFLSFIILSLAATIYFISLLH